MSNGKKDMDSIQKLIEAAEGVTFDTEGWEPVRPVDVRRVLYWEAVETVCKGDGEPDTNMWAEHRRAGRPVVIACSEWP